MPTMLRAVSGRKLTIAIKANAESILKNQKIHLQPARSASTPPNTGPRLGAVFGLLGCQVRRRRECSECLEE